MESTEHVLGEQHLAGCLALSKSANWNQNEADWRLMLGFGRGWGITTADGMLAASTLALPYGKRFAWVAMVLVLPEHRRRGYATQLLRVALTDLGKQGQTAILDATPAGLEVYLQEGFSGRWGFKRYALSTPATGLGPAEAQPLRDEDWNEVLALDLRAFGASREPVLRDLAARLPAAALVVRRGGKLHGFLFGRDGREACQLGPLVAGDSQAAIRLLSAALARVPAPVYVDIADHAAELQSWAEARGFAFQRPFTRMLHGPAQPAPGEQSLVFCPAGPELG